MEEIIHFTVNLLDKNSKEPINGDTFQVKFFDKDALKDDFLGTASPDSDGNATVSITQSDFRSADSPLEKYPDIYFTVEKNGEIVYKSPIYPNLHWKEISDFSTEEGLVCDLGTYFI